MERRGSAVALCVAPSIKLLVRACPVSGNRGNDSRVYRLFFCLSSNSATKRTYLKAKLSARWKSFFSLIRYKTGMVSTVTAKYPHWTGGMPEGSTSNHWDAIVYWKTIYIYINGFTITIILNEKGELSARCFNSPPSRTSNLIYDNS